MLALCVVFAGCGGGCGGSTVGPGEDPPSEQAGGDDSTSEGPSEGAASPSAPVDPGPPPVLRVAGEPDPHDRLVALRIENRGAEAAELAGTVTLERRAGETWSPVEGVSLDLRFSCEDPAPECVTLAPGGIYLPPPWRGVIGDAQCDCERCAAAPAGDYRVVVRSCNQAHAVESEAFALRAD